MKIIRVEACVYCPDHKTRFCFHGRLFKAKEIVDITTIPQWCPLEDAPGDECQDKLDKILAWCEAYPIEVFPEPTKVEWEYTLDQISDSSIRHVVEGIKKLIMEGR